MKKPIKFRYQFTSDDIPATVVALTLVPEMYDEDEDGYRTCQTTCISAINKLVDGNMRLQPNELYVVGLGVEFAKEFLAGHIDCEIEADTVEKLRRHFFAYNRLYAAFRPLLEQMETQLDN